MNAIISGRAGVAMILNGDEVASLRVGSGELTSESRLEDFPFLFGDAKDLQFLEDVELSEVAKRLAGEFAKELALQLVLVFLDRGLSPRTRRTAGEELETLFQHDSVGPFVESVLCAHVLPVGADLIGALASIPGDASRVRSFVEHLRANQGHIAAVQMAWEEIPTRIFGGERERSQARAMAVRAGWFRDLVRWRAEGVGGTPTLVSPQELWPPVAPDVLLQEWLKDLRIAGEDSAEEMYKDTEVGSLSFVAEGAGDPEEAISHLYGRLREVRARAVEEPGLAGLRARYIEKLRMLQALEAQKIMQRYKATLSLPHDAGEVRIMAERMLSA